MRTETSPLRGRLANQSSGASPSIPEHLRARKDVDTRIANLARSTTDLVPYRDSRPQSMSLQERALELSQKPSLTDSEAKELASLVRRAFQTSEPLQKFYSRSRYEFPPFQHPLPPDHYEDRMLAKHRARNTDLTQDRTVSYAMPTSSSNPQREELDKAQAPKKTVQPRRFGIEPHQTNRPHNPHWGDTY